MMTSGLWLPVILLVFLSGCSASAPLPHQSPQDSFMEMATGSISAVHPGPVDSMNAYASNVAITVDAKKVDGSEGCSGVLISSSLVLTAGHCLCMKQSISTTENRTALKQRLDELLPSRGNKELDELKARVMKNAAAVIDSAHCAKEVDVKFVEYMPSRPNIKSKATSTEYSGAAIRPHPGLLIIEDAEGTTWFREADLAFIRLATPVEDPFRSVKLPATEIQAGDKVVLVGYGFGANGRTTKSFGDRHYGESRVVSIERTSSGGVKFLARKQPRGDGPPPRIYPGDSGGGCFSQADDTVLVGIASAVWKDGESSIFTSVYPYRQWIREELKNGSAALPGNTASESP